MLAIGILVMAVLVACVCYVGNNPAYVNDIWVIGMSGIMIRFNIDDGAL